MRDLGTRLLIGLAAVMAGVMAIGYAFIFGGVAAPPGGLGTLAVPVEGQTVAARLDDGRPVFVTAAGGTAWVLDAREPRPAGELDVLVGWCPADQAFIGSGPSSIFAADGSSLRGSQTGGMTAHATTPADGEASRVVVGAATSVRPVAAEQRVVSYRCGPEDWVVHGARADEIFDPSVAADAEPPGWIWLEGTLVAVGEQAFLCDGLGSTDGCAMGVAASGIDPATLTAGGVAGLFLGTVHDGTIEGLTLAPVP